MASDRDAESRRRARADWPVSRYLVGEEPSDDLSDVTTPAERIAIRRREVETSEREAQRQDEEEPVIETRPNVTRHAK